MCGISFSFNGYLVTQITELVECAVLGLFGVAFGEVVAVKITIGFAALEHIPNSYKHGVLEG